MITLRGSSNSDISNTGVIKNWFQLPTLIQLVKEGLWINDKTNIRIINKSVKKSNRFLVCFGVRMQVVDSGENTNKECISCVSEKIQNQN